MKALQVARPRTFDLVDLPIPEVGADGSERILVHTRWVSLCGSDIPFFTGSKRTKPYPLAPGAPIHECVGWIVKSTSRKFQPGDAVLAIPEGDQGLAEFFAARADKAVKLPEELVDTGTGCLIQPLSTVLNAVDRLGSIDGKSAAVIGLGSIGLFFCWLLKERGAASILGIDPCEQRCRLALDFGASWALPQRSIEVVHAARRSSAEWHTPDICIEAVGHQPDTLNDCLELVRKRGTVLAFGVPDHPVYPIEYEIFFRKNAHLLAVVTPDWSEYLLKARTLFLENQAKLESLVTHHFPIREAGQTFTLYESHSDGMIKALMDASHW